MRLLPALPSLCLCLAAACTLPAQQPAAATPKASARPDQVGTVTGHVTCADTQRPARLAKVSLVPAVHGESLVPGENGQDESGLRPASEAVETSLDGSYTLRNIKPGEYYLIVDKDGYELPLAEFTAADLAKPSEATRQRIAARLHPIRVVAQTSVEENVALARGAAVEGTVTYDDGSPAGELAMILLMKDADGKWQPGIQSRYRNFFGFARTDDFGHFRVTGLPAGDYALETDLSLEEFTTTTTKMPSQNGGEPTNMTMRMARTKFNLPLFSGNVWRKPKAQSFSLGAGEQRTGMNLEFPLSKLHRATGQVLARDGHALNAGKLELLYADDKSKVTEADIDTADRNFQLEFVPEGEFTLKASGLSDVALVQIANAPGTTPRFHDETRTQRTYGPTEQPLIVLGDVNDIVMTAPDPTPAKP